MLTKKQKRRQRKEMEYPDSPSGYVTLYNYKEPYMDFEGGFGYQGTLLFDGETDKIQCHLCGNWFEHLVPHIAKEHNMRASQYKEIVGLNQTTALISEKVREKLIANGLDKRLQNLRSRKGIKMSQETKDKIRETLRKNGREMQNIRGSCPAQIIERLVKKYNELGRTPTGAEMGEGFYETTRKVYGSFKEACAVAGIEHRKPGINVSYVKKKYTEDELVKDMVKFYKNNGRMPVISDCKRGLLASDETYRRRFGKWKVAIELARKLI